MLYAPLCDARPQRPHDGYVAIDADGHQGVGADQDGDHLRVVDKVAQDNAERPVVEDVLRDEGGGHAEEGHEYVAQCQIGYEIVGDCAHARRRLHNVADDAVAEQSKYEDGYVEQVDDALEVVAGPQVVRMGAGIGAAKVKQNGHIEGGRGRWISGFLGQQRLLCGAAVVQQRLGCVRIVLLVPQQRLLCRYVVQALFTPHRAFHVQATALPGQIFKLHPQAESVSYFLPFW